jgi:hypothetical protein
MNARRAKRNWLEPTGSGSSQGVMVVKDCGNLVVSPSSQ